MIAIHILSDLPSPSILISPDNCLLFRSSIILTSYPHHPGDTLLCVVVVVSHSVLVTIDALISDTRTTLSMLLFSIVSRYGVSCAFENPILLRSTILIVMMCFGERGGKNELYEFVMEVV